MKNLKKTKLNIYLKIILVEIAVAFGMRYLVPILATYPPFSEEHHFQSLIEPFTHEVQYIALGLLGVIIHIVLIRIIFKDVFKYIDSKNKSSSKHDLNRIRKTCFNITPKLYLIQFLLLVLLLATLFLTVEISLNLMFKLLLIYFSFFIAAASLSNILIQSDLNIIIKSTYANNEIGAVLDFKKGQFYRNIMISLLPFLVVIIIALILIGYSSSSVEKGNSGYYYYKTYVDQIASEQSSLAELKEELSTIPLLNEVDYFFILYDGNTYISKDNGNLSHFFITYIDVFAEDTSGHVYEYYGIEEQGYVRNIQLSNYNDVIIGIKYSVTDSTTILYFFTIALGGIILYSFIISMWSRRISKNIADVSNNLKEISNTTNIMTSSVLPPPSNDEIGDLVSSFNKIQASTKNYIVQIEENQEMLMEKERLASLGQLIGGIAHNLKTPIMSISGAAEGLNDLIKEYDSSIEDKEVTPKDHHEIAEEMSVWITKIRSYTEYMSDVITAVKGQAVNFINDETVTFTLDELIKRIDILMKHELKYSHTVLNMNLNVEPNLVLNGDINSLIQVINNMISNAIQAYDENNSNKQIDLNVNMDNNKVFITVQDYGVGLPDSIKEKLFKEMITTKGKNGTGLGLYMSYSTIRGHFNGDILVESEKNQGTKFTIILPL